MSIQTIAIVHHAHTDFGYTDHPCRAKREHVKYINQAVDYVLASGDYPEGSRFAWTQEQLYPIRQWWETATETEKERFFQAIQTGRLEIAGTPFNVTAFLSREEWEAAMTWIPDDLWNRCRISTAMQNDINGMHTAGMACAYDRGIRNLWIGPNSYYGGPPIPAPAAFNWQIAPDRQMFVWLNSCYNNGFYMFNPYWRQGPVPNYSDLRYRAPEADDIWCSDELSIRKAHKLCLEHIARMEGNTDKKSASNTDSFTKSRTFGGYSLSTLPVSVTSEWRIDNDPPFYPLADFVRKWNEMGLQPRLVLCTVTQAMDMVRKELGNEIPAYSGEWVDWWANGNASSPVELSINRQAKRVLKVAKSDLFGPLTEEQKIDARQVMENICLYDEHTFGSWQSISNPYAFAAISQAAEKNAYAYRALDGAQCLLADRVRPLIQEIKNEIVVWNPGSIDLSTKIELPLNSMRGEYHSVFCKETKERFPISYVDGVANFLRPSSPAEFGPENVSKTFCDRCEKQGIVFGTITIPAMECLHFVPSTEKCAPIDLNCHPVSTETDANGWPVHILFEGQSQPIVCGSFGEFVAVNADGFSPRWTFKDIFENDDAVERRRLRKEHLSEITADYGQASCTTTIGNICYEQEIIHPALQYGKRILNIDTINNRIALELRIDRRSNFAPEVLFLHFKAPETMELPFISNAGKPFRPIVDQLPGSCMDFFAIDGWIHYPNGWMLNCRDNAIVSFGSTSVAARKSDLQGEPNDIYVRLFDNIWDTNFTANACGMMQFGFTIAADIPINEAANIAESMNFEPVVAVKMGY